MANDNNVTSLVNRALTFLGEQLITNADAAETPAGRKLVDIYPMCRKEVLRRVSWNFAESWGVLDYFGPAPAGFDYADTYALPPDYIRIVDLPGTTPSTPSSGTGIAVPVDYASEDYSIQDYRFIQMNGQRLVAVNNNAANTLNMAYIADMPNLTMWDPLALKVLAMWMALDVAKGITGQDALVMQLDKMLTLDLQDAVGVNGNEQRKRLHVYSPSQRERETAWSSAGSYFTPVTGYGP